MTRFSLPDQHTLNTFRRIILLMLWALSAYIPLAYSAHFSELDESRINQLAVQLPELPSGIGPACSDRTAWNAPVIQSRVAAFVGIAEKLLATPFPAWSDDAYLEYSRQGSRPNGERMMNARKAWLYPLVLAECVENKGRFLPAIEHTLSELNNQTTWTWPAHDAKLRSFRDHDYEVDLMASDTGHDVAQTLYMLGDKLASSTRQQTMAALEARVFAPLRHSFISGNKDNWWLHADHNWNAVCLEASVAAALAVLPARGDRALFAAAGGHYIRNYVSGFSDDGYTVEGPGYWNYGFSHFTELREVLMQSTGKHVDLFADPKVRNMALYGVRIEMFPGNSAAFGDASPNTRMDAMTIAYSNEALQLGLPQHLADTPITTKPSANDAPLANAVLLLFVHPAVLPATTNEPIGLRSYFDDVGILVARPAPDSGSKLAVSIKAGGNGNHSHNDIGSYTIALSNEQPTGDVGHTQYSSKTFSKERYTIKGISSWGHPVPVVAGRLQGEADKLKPKVLSTHFTPEADDIIIDLKSAYAVAALRTLTRRMHYERANAGLVQIEDRFEYTDPQSFEVAITTLGNWQQRGDGSIELWMKNQHLLAHIDASAPYELSAEKSSEEGLSFTRIAIRLKTPQTSGFVRISYTPE